MTRCIVFETKGKLDLRAITVFGLNSKPETTSPIGYFGTGLKYAIAILMRKRIQFEIWIDGKKWTVETVGTQFRDKQFESLYLMRHTLVRKTINLPFTTELGKNWELWQAFRELYSNTLDEKGRIALEESNDWDPDFLKAHLKGYTHIIVYGDAFVEEYHNRERTFIPEGLRLQEGTDRIQAFAAPSKHVYYRGIRVMDLQEPSENTYNILAKMELTEDRTIKDEWSVKYEIENFLKRTQDTEIVRRAITAPPKSLERAAFRYSSGTASPVLLDAIESAGDKAAPEFREVLKTARPPKIDDSDLQWIDYLDAFITDSNWDMVTETIAVNKQEVKIALTDYKAKLIRAREAQEFKEKHEDDILY